MASNTNATSSSSRANGSEQPDLYAPVTSTITRTSPREAITKLSDKQHLDETNWPLWRDRITRLLKLSGVEEYITGTIKEPVDKSSENAKNWSFNDNFAQVIIVNNITSAEMVHVGQCKTAKDIWDNLEAVHESKGHQTIVSIIRNLFHTKADDESNITEHLTQLKKYWERINQMDEEDFKISDTLFKIIISSSLPLSWDTFTEPYVGRRKGLIEVDPKKLMGSQQFIGILKEEYIQRQLCTEETVNYVTPNGSLQNRLTSSKPSKGNTSNTDTGMYCKHCGRKNHNTPDCNHLGKSKCSFCRKFGHTDDKCWEKKKGKRKKDDKPEKTQKKQKKIEVHETEECDEEDEEEITLNTEEFIEENSNTYFDESEQGQYYNINSDGTYIRDEINEPVIYYDWFSDSATSSHVTNNRDIFISYQPLLNTSVIGVGRNKAKVEGKGTIEIQSQYKGRTYKLKLQNVLHIPTNRNNLLSLGRWDAAGGSYTGGGGKIILKNKTGQIISSGSKISNHLYKMEFKTYLPRNKITVQKDIVLNTEEIYNWETWHRRFGHVSYSGLQKLFDKNIVEGFNVDIRSPKPDCEACIQAKHTISPFNGKSDRNTKPGDLTHIDLWGKYQTQSINGNQYYILFVDDAARYITVFFLKRKEEAGQYVKNYLTNLKTHDKNPKAIRVDRGSEFLNQTLYSWCNENGIDIQTTAPYSPSQNGIAERMNRTLVELGRAMVIGQNVPEFLWEYAITHAAYLRNRSTTTFLNNATPYQLWNKKKPNVNHLREFSATVWVLLQGQKIPRKILPKSQKRIYVGFDDRSKSVKYYNANTRKILTSRNYRFFSITEKSPTEEVVVAPDMPREGEMREGTLPTGSDSYKRKRRLEEEQIEPISQKRTKRVDYRYLDDPFRDDDQERDQIEDQTGQIFSVSPSGEPISLEEAKRSSEWKYWEEAI